MFKFPLPEMVDSAVSAIDGCDLHRDVGVIGSADPLRHLNVPFEEPHFAQQDDMPFNDLK